LSAFDGRAAPPEIEVNVVPEENPAAIDILRRTFGYAEFREHQAEVISHVTGGKDAFVLMPTGMGKSICYQIPSMLMDGVGIVISPLIALMQDQVNALRLNGVRAEFLNSGLPPQQAGRVKAKVARAGADLLYVAPERLLTPSFQAFLDRLPIALFAVDEAHCVSQWGHDFRPEYLRIPEVTARFPGVPKIALTATADTQTRSDILGKLELRKPALFISSFDRPNIQYRVGLKQKGRAQLLRFVEAEHTGDSGIVYVRTRKRADQIADWLSDHKLAALPYHAGLDAKTRVRNQQRFLEAEGIVMVATIAFGMGIDKPDVRFVAHLDLPASMEAYYQETGRAGRDGEPANAWMVYSLGDLVAMRRLLEASEGDDAFKQIQRKKLNSLLGFCESVTCRRRVLLRYFGETYPQACGNCDTCLQPPESWDGTVAAQKALSCVYRTGQRFGAAYLTDVLVGEQTPRVQSFGHHRIRTFGVGSDMNRQQWHSVFRQLVASGLLTVGDSAVSGFRLGPESRPVLRGEKKVLFRKDPEKVKSPRKRKKAAPPAADLSPGEQLIFERLRDLRLETARELGIPPYLVFHDKALQEMAQAAPETIEELLCITGVGEKKAAQYGAAFIEAIAEGAGLDGSKAKA
jgi:ATP-dependent DNA helicase RecQ